MGILRDFEQRLEGAVEGFFARAFRSGLQPVELAKAVQRYAGNQRQVGVDGVFIPNAYRITLAPGDLERFSGYGEALQHELAGVVHRTARERGWKLKGPPRVELLADPEIRVGTYELRGKAEASQAAARSPAHVPPPGSRAAFAATTVAMDAPTPATIEILDAGHHGEPVRVRPGSVLGRLPECDVTVDDPSVSRRHARLSSDNGRWRIEDLGSTNGLKVDGERVGEAALGNGAEISLGSARLRFAAGNSGSAP